MRQFFKASDEAFLDLEGRARSGGYVQFRDEELPVGCVPGRARIGFRIDPASGAATLYVEKGHRFYGVNKVIERWIREGEIVFPRFAELRHWILSELKEAFNDPTEPAAHKEASGTRRAEPAASTVIGRTTESVDPVLKCLLLSAVIEVGRSYNLDVEAIDDALVLELGAKLRSNISSASPETVLDDILGGPFALAALQEHRTVSVQAGPPINCQPIPAKSS